MPRSQRGPSGRQRHSRQLMAAT